jgi:hypothetical protein
METHDQPASEGAPPNFLSVGSWIRRRKNRTPREQAHNAASAFTAENCDRLAIASAEVTTPRATRTDQRQCFCTEVFDGMSD